jgi:holo-[acyl-carrier protein] synthase
MTAAVGIDITEIDRVGAALGRFGERFLKRVYTDLEVAVCRGRSDRPRVSELAARFAAKEAVMKALGTGAKGVAWREIEVLPNRRGKPLVYLHGRALARAEKIELTGLDISLTHDGNLALAMVVGQSRDLVQERGEWREELADYLRKKGALEWAATD